MDKSFDHEEIKRTHFGRSNVIAKCSLVTEFLKAVPGSVQHNTAGESTCITEVPLISGEYIPQKYEKSAHIAIFISSSFK